MLNYIRAILVSLAIFVLVVPDSADARAGGGRSSFGSRGIKTYSPSKSSAAPIQRSTTNQPTQAPNQANQPGFNSSQPAGMMPTGGTFWRGMAGGFLGAGIASMLFGHSANAMGSGAGGSGSAFGGLLQILLIGGIGYFAYRMFSGRAARSLTAPASNFFANNFSTSPNAYAQQSVDNLRPLDISESDKATFEQLLKKIQHSWSEGEINKLRQLVTPEMLQYFSEEMSANSSRGLANKVENVTLESADIIESWKEFDLEYATVRLEWSAFDYMVSLDKNQGEDGYVALGSNSKTELAEEIWTFARSSGGNWLLSAIQQLN